MKRPTVIIAVLMMLTVGVSFLGCSKREQGAVLLQEELGTSKQEALATSAKEVGKSARTTKTRAELVLKNATSFSLTLSIDGEKSCSAPPGDQCVDLVTPGWHDLKAEETFNPENYVTRTANIPPEGATWTITEKKK